MKAAQTGLTEEKNTKDFMGNRVLSAYTPIDALGNSWVLLAEIQSSEAYAPIWNLILWVVGIGLLSAILTSLFGIVVGRKMATPILDVASHLQVNSNEVTSASLALSNSSQKVAELVSEQSSSIEETAATLEEMSAMVKNNVEQAEKSDDLSESVKGFADKGIESMKKLIASMSMITESNEKIQDLVQIIGEIGEKTNIIDEIVFQTKLLSFNASVEAERAGEHGRGFAVVAQEVGNLAQMSGKAALEISMMVKESIKSTEDITKENKERVQTGSNLVSENAAILEEIVKSSEILSNQAKQIVVASREQDKGIEQVNGAISQLEMATQHNATSSEETANASKKLKLQSDTLGGTVQELLFYVNGDQVNAHESEHVDEEQEQAQGGLPEEEEILEEMEEGNLDNVVSLDRSSTVDNDPLGEEDSELDLEKRDLGDSEDDDDMWEQL